MYALRLIAGFGSNIDFSVGILLLDNCGLFRFKFLATLCFAFQILSDCPLLMELALVPVDCSRFA